MQDNTDNGNTNDTNTSEEEALNQQRLKQLQEEIQECDRTERLLAGLSSRKPGSAFMSPLGSSHDSCGFMLASLKDNTHVIAHLGEEYYVRCSVAAAQGVLARRATRLRAKLISTGLGIGVAPHEHDDAAQELQQIAHIHEEYTQEDEERDATKARTVIKEETQHNPHTPTPLTPEAAEKAARDSKMLELLMKKVRLLPCSSYWLRSASGKKLSLKGNYLEKLLFLKVKKTKWLNRL